MGSCLACGGPLRPAFSKVFDFEGLGEVHYERCVGCGFVRSATHAEMEDARWQQVNAAFHGRRGEGRATSERWLERLHGYADALSLAAGAGALPLGRRWLDYGCGEGRLATMVERRTEHPISRYEPFLGDRPSTPGFGPWVDEGDLGEGTCDLVINTAMFEHVRDRAPLDRIAALLSQDGVLALHTVVVERIPDDPDWSYLLPVHCAFFTNEAMRRLCSDWGLVASAYHVPGRLWLLMRRPLSALPEGARAIFAGDDWVAADSFVDYW